MAERTCWSGEDECSPRTATRTARAGDKDGVKKQSRKRPCSGAALRVNTHLRRHSSLRCHSECCPREFKDFFRSR